MLALVAALTTLLAGFLPLVNVPGEPDVGFFSCRDLPGCSWLALWFLAASAALVMIGVGILVRPDPAGSGVALVAAAAIGGLGFLGWAGFVTSVDDFGASLGPGPLVGILGGIVGVVGGIVLIVAGPRTVRGTTPAPGEGVPARVAPLAPILGIASAAIVAAAVLLPYLRNVEGVDGRGDLSIVDCGSEGCAWFALDPIALALVLLGLAVLSFANVMRAGVAAASFALAGGWSVVLFVGYMGNATNAEVYGGGAGGGPAGWIGVAAGVLSIAAAVVAWLWHPHAPNARPPVSA